MSTNRLETADWGRFLKYVRKQEDGCWIWVGAKRGNGRNEYGAFWWYGTQRAHRVSYLWTYGEPNHDLHHICGQPLCVNPEHVTPAAAGQPRHRGPSPNLCAHGHEFTPENTYINPRGERQCRSCLRAAANRYKDANRDRINKQRREQRVHVVHEPRECLASDCHNMFTPVRSGKRFCSGACYQRAKNRGEV